MSKTFEKLPEEKRKRITEISLEEFAQNGYDRASTNSIIKKAGISKGILFHYFGSKKNLYLYLFDEVLEYYVQSFFEGGTTESSDLFERLMRRSARKMQLAQEDPVKYQFMLDAFLHTPEEVQREVSDKIQAFTAIQLPLTFKDIDTSLFRRDIDPDKAMGLVALCMEALNARYLQKLKNGDDWQLSSIEPIMQESREYLEMLKYGIYKK